MEDTVKDRWASHKPNLILVKDEPLKYDKNAILDSPDALDYLVKCFDSKFKAPNTHVSYIKDPRYESFSRGKLVDIIMHYLKVKDLNLNTLCIAFVGEESLAECVRDVYNLDTKYGIGGWIDQENRYLSVQLPDRVKLIKIPYVVLPSITDVTERITDALNLVVIKEGVVTSPYCGTAQLLSKLKFIRQLHASGDLNNFEFEAYVSESPARVEYFTIYDLYTGITLTYSPNDVICACDTKEDKRALQAELRDTLLTVPVYGEYIGKFASLVPWGSEIRSIAHEERDTTPVKRTKFEITGSEKGNRSEWYDKWQNEAYKPTVRQRLKTHEITRNGYNRSAMYEWIYDIEVFKEDWLFVAKSMDGKSKLVCWNDAERLNTWVRDKILIGFNNAAYDNPVITHAMSMPYTIESDRPTVKEFSDDMITEDQNFRRYFAIKPDIKDKNIAYPTFLSWDVSFHGPFDIRRNSLKKLTMSVLDKRNYDSGVPFDIDRSLTKAEMDEVEQYCELDVDNTRELFLPDPNNPKRTFARESYDIKWNLIVTYEMEAKTLSNKSSSFAGKLLCGEDAKANPDNTFKMVDGKLQYYSIPELAYKELADTEILDFYLKHQTNPEYISEKLEIQLGGDDEGHKYQFGFGGLHQALIKYGSTNLVNMDVASLYPSLLVEYDLMSRGASKNPESYRQVYETRLTAKREGKTLLNLGLKLILNGAIGAMLSAFNPLYDTWSNSSICVHGQLLLYILVKRLYDAGFNIVQTNTDGIMIDGNEGVDYMPICTEWEKQTRLILEYDQIDVLQQNNVNNYYCQFKPYINKQGKEEVKIKSKGFYLSNEKFGKATSKILCNLVTGKPLLDGCAPRDFVIYKRHSIGEIYDGITRTKLEGRSLAFVLGYESDYRTQAFYSRSRNTKQVVKKDEKGKSILDENGEKVMETIHGESTITGFSDHMLLIDDVNTLTMDEINTAGYVAFAKNLLSKEEDFGPYYTEGFLKVDEPAFLQALNPLKDQSDRHPTKSGVICQNFLFECDYLSREEQIEMIEKHRDIFYRIVWSGSKSFHCVIRLDQPVTSTSYSKIWHYLRYKYDLHGADDQCSLPNKYTRVPGQINPKTGNEQELYAEDGHVLPLAEIVEDMPMLKDVFKPVKLFTGKVTLEALKRHIKRKDWSGGNRFAAVQKLSPNLITLVSFEELIAMIPTKLDKDHLAVIRGKYHYYNKYKQLNELELRDESE